MIRLEPTPEEVEERVALLRARIALLEQIVRLDPTPEREAELAEERIKLEIASLFLPGREKELDEHISPWHSAAI